MEAQFVHRYRRFYERGNQAKARASNVLPLRHFSRLADWKMAEASGGRTRFMSRLCGKPCVINSRKCANCTNRHLLTHDLTHVDMRLIAVVQIVPAEGTGRSEPLSAAPQHPERTSISIYKRGDRGLARVPSRTPDDTLFAQGDRNTIPSWIGRIGSKSRNDASSMSYAAVASRPTDSLRRKSPRLDRETSVLSR